MEVKMTSSTAFEREKGLRNGVEMMISSPFLLCLGVLSQQFQKYHGTPTRAAQTHTHTHTHTVARQL
jgi:hypothetical protein